MFIALLCGVDFVLIKKMQKIANEMKMKMKKKLKHDLRQNT